MSRDRVAAGRAVGAALAERGWTAADLMRETGLDSGTVGDFLAGTRWPQAPTRGKIERALGWDYGSIQLIAEGEAPPRSLTPPPDESSAVPLDVIDAILADPYLLPEAKEHFLSQYTLLLRVQAMSRPEDVSKATDRPDPVTDRRRPSLRSLPAVAHGAGSEHAEEVARMAREIRARMDRERGDDGG